MNIRLVNREEILDVLHLAWEVYREDYLPLENDEKIKEFQNIIKYENFIHHYDKGEVIVFGVYEMNGLKGALILNRGGFVSMIFVQKDFRNKQMAKSLMQEAADFASRNLHIPGLSVYSDQNHIEFYEKLGFKKASALIGQTGLSGSLMLRPLRPMTNHHSGYGGKPKVFIPVLVGIGIFLLLLLSFASIRRMSQQSLNQYHNGGDFGQIIPFDLDEFYDEQEEPDDDYWDSGNSQKEFNEEFNGLEGITAYQEADLGFDLEKEKYTENINTENKYIDFDVVYPSLNGLSDKVVEDQINEEIRRTAMATVEELYTNPKEEVKEQILKSDKAYLVSYVKYKVTYLNKDLISIIFDDNTCKITEDNVKTHLRTLTVNLKNGQVYQVKDLINLNDDFLEDFRINMQIESGDADFLTDLEEEDLKKALEGGDTTKEYVPQFFLDANGIDIGFDITPTKESVVDHFYSWITTHFSEEEINTYKSSSDLWGLTGDFMN